MSATDPGSEGKGRGTTLAEADAQQDLRAVPKDASKTFRAAPIPVILKASVRGAERTKLARRIEDLFRARGARARILRLGPDGRVPRVSGGGKLRTVVAGGGDGTVATVAAKLVGKRRSLGVLPLGTFNHFAKDAGIPLDLEGAVEVILAGRARRIDVGQVNGRVFLNNSSVGTYPEIVRRREKRREQLGLGKLPAFALATLRTLQRPPLLDIELRIKAGALARRTAGIFFGNNVYAMQGRRIGDERDLVGRAPLAMEMLARCGADVLLAGHLHVSHTGHTATRYKIEGHSALVVQAGTATSTRERGERNSFNVLRVSRPDITVERYAWGEGGGFQPAASEEFRHTPTGWVRASPKKPVAKEEPAREEAADSR